MGRNIASEDTLLPQYPLAHVLASKNTEILAAAFQDYWA
jgi:hypothetical protein